MNSFKTLKIAATLFYWKPMTALFRSLEMNAYCASGVVLRSPMLDLGCGDGLVARMLQELEVVEAPPLCGVEISLTGMKKARQTNAHQNLLQGDANHLPFKNESFAAIVCNGVLCSIPEGADQGLAEISRILKPKGTLVVTVPTDDFIKVLPFPVFLQKISGRLGRLYVKRINVRLPHFNTFSADQWARKLEANGLRVVKRQAFFSTRAGFIWNVLAMRIFHIFGLLKFVNNRILIGAVSAVLGVAFKGVYINDFKADSKFGYEFIIARK